MTKTSGILACLIVGVASVSLPACSGSNSSSSSSTPSKADQCKALYSAECDKVYECLTAAELAQISGFGTSKADCPAALEARVPCDTLTVCDPGQTYQSAKATECTNAVSSATCATFTDPNAAEPAACNEICKDGPTGSGGASGSSGSSGSAGAGTGAMDGITECKKQYTIECDKIFTCFTADELAAAADTLGTSKAECETNLEAANPCLADQCNGGVFDGAQAEKCLDAFNALTCDQFTGLGSTTSQPVECSTVCK